ncbi:unnamed protein product [Chrysoparadoxa australica]
MDDPPFRSKFKSVTAAEVSSSGQGHAKRATSVAWNASGSKLASASRDTTAKIWKLDPQGNARLNTTLTGHTDYVESVKWHPLKNDVLCTAGNKCVKAWDARSGKPSHSIELAGHPLHLAWNPDGKCVAVSTKENNVSFYDTRQWKKIKGVKFSYDIHHFDWALNAETLFFGVENGTGGQLEIMTYRKAGLTKEVQLQVHTAPCTALAVDPLCRYVATGGEEALVVIWDLEEFTSKSTIDFHKSWIRSLCFSSAGEYLATASKEGSVIHSMASGEAAHRIDAPLNEVAWHPAQLVLAGASNLDPIEPSNSWGGSSARRDSGIRVWSFRE